MIDELIERRSLGQVRLRVVSTLTARFGSSLFAFALSLYVFSATGNSISFGINMIAAPIATVALSPIVGRVIDAVPHKRIAIVSQGASVLTVIGFALSYQRVDDNHLVVYCFLIVLLLKISDEFILLTLVASSINIVLEAHQTKMRSYQQVAANIANILAPLIGGALFGLTHFFVIVGIEALCETLTLVLIGLLNFSLVATPARHADPTTPGSDLPQNQIRATLRWVRKQKYLRALVAIACVTYAVDGVLIIAPPIIILSIFGLDNTFYSIASATMVLGELLAGLIVAQLPSSTQPLARLLNLALIASMMLLLLGVGGALESHVGYVVLIIALFAIPFIESLYGIPLQVWYVTEVPAAIQGKVFSLLGALMTATMPIAIFIFSMLYNINTLNVVTLNAVVVATAVVARVGVLGYFKAVKKVDFAAATIE